MLSRNPTPVNLTEYTNNELISKIDLFMYDINMPRNLRGYKYLSSAVRMVYLDPDLINNVLKGLYLYIAHEYKTSVPCVERNIRTAINNVWTCGNTEKLDFYLERFVHTPETKPTAKEFIAIVSDKLRRNLIFSKL